MQSHRQALADRISAARVELKAAEKAMADAYGGPIEALSMALRVMFGPDELRRFIRFWRGMPVRDHFIDGNLFDAPGEVFVTKYAAMMILFNADSSKVAVAVAQSYFALLCDKQGLEDEKRIRSRLDVTTENTKLSGVAKETGVQDFQKFNGMGVSGLYGGLNVRQIVARKKLKPGSQHLDFAGSEELAANLFRITQTAAALRRAGRVGEATACRTHEQIGRGIRQAILSAGNRPPEDLPAAGMAIDQTATKVKKSLKSGK